MNNLYEDMPSVAFWDLQYGKPYDALKFIADQIRKGCGDPHFIQQLANSIDPDAKSMTGVKLVIERPGGRRAPKSAPNHDLERFMQDHIDFLGEPRESVACDAAKIFNVSKKTAENALANIRKRAKKNPEFAQMMKESTLIIKQQGHPDMRPSSEILREKGKSSAR